MKPVSSTALMFVSRKRPYTKTIPQIARQAVPRTLPRCSSFFWSGVLSSSKDWIIWAMRPIWVFMPVQVTRPLPRP